MPKQPALRLVETRRGCAIAEPTPRYDALLNGKVVERLWFNMRGYLGYLPTPSGSYYSIGEKSIGVYRREIAHLNRIYAEATKDNSVKHHVAVQFVLDGGSRLLSSGDPLPLS
jgi:hypothetical protein